ncbi:hypothetical protein NE237_014650 [Protea cynaroides]|uniref:PRONE domain-containing protein n=1 Tax=Protea cynaroides TaxID=273540 RepID=A0A9Q0QQG7_9MAGN|nr:hypothetical protein NE237_014650 [Protea cynaroides]
MLPVIGGRDVVVWEEKPAKQETDLSEVELMKERFTKLFLGEDMSGGGKGVGTALAISNAITNLSVTVSMENGISSRIFPSFTTGALRIDVICNTFEIICRVEMVAQEEIMEKKEKGSSLGGRENQSIVYGFMAQIRGTGTLLRFRQLVEGISHRGRHIDGSLGSFG